MKRRLAVVGGAVAMTVAGCSLRPAPRAPVAVYDLVSRSPEGRVAPGSELPVVVVVHEPVGPLWLDSGRMHYRLAYDDPGRVRRYGNSQWATSPLRLVGARLREVLALRTTQGGAVPDLGIFADYSVRVVVDDFDQVFDAPGRSRARVRFRVLLVRSRGQVFLGQRTFLKEVDAPSADARGGVEALGRATASAVDEAVDWVVEVVGKDLE